ncbi:MAG: hypothetical protein MZV63_23665 [Marinilabiliales bacterium]|nr:hypothetical protein [Marinilabiliales bacterium]
MAVGDGATGRAIALELAATREVPLVDGPRPARHSRSSARSKHLLVARSSRCASSLSRNLDWPPDEVRGSLSRPEVHPSSAQPGGCERRVTPLRRGGNDCAFCRWCCRPDQRACLGDGLSSRQRLDRDPGGEASRWGLRPFTRHLAGRWGVFRWAELAVDPRLGIAHGRRCGRRLRDCGALRATCRGRMRPVAHAEPE